MTYKLRCSQDKGRDRCRKHNVTAQPNIISPYKPILYGSAFFLATKGVLCYDPTMVVRMRHTRSHTKNRRSHHALKGGAIVRDPETGTPHMRHRVSLADGRYKGKKVIDMVKKVEKKQKKSK